MFGALGRVIYRGSGSKFEPAFELIPGVGYEVKVAQAITFRYVEI